MSESKVQSECIKLLDEFGYVTCKIIVANKGGVLDIIACSPNGRYVEIEVKFGSNKMSALQTLRQQAVIGNKGISFTVYSKLELIEELKKHGLEREPAPKQYKLSSKPLI